jgi:hypothetical protein
MEKNLAARIIENIRSMDGQFNALYELIEEIADESEKMQVRKHVADVMGILHGNIEIPIFRQYRDLNPDR